MGVVSVQFCHFLQLIELILIRSPSAGKSMARQGTEYENGTCCTFVSEDKPQTNEDDNPGAHLNFSWSLDDRRNC